MGFELSLTIHSVHTISFHFPLHQPPADLLAYLCWATPLPFSQTHLLQPYFQCVYVLLNLVYFTTTFHACIFTYPLIHMPWSNSLTIPFFSQWYYYLYTQNLLDFKLESLLDSSFGPNILFLKMMQSFEKKKQQCI